MRSIYADGGKEAKRRGQQGRRDMVAKYSLPVMGSILREEIERIEKEVLPSDTVDAGRDDL